MIPIHASFHLTNIFYELFISFFIICSAAEFQKPGAGGHEKAEGGRNFVPPNFNNNGAPHDAFMSQIAEQLKTICKGDVNQLLHCLNNVKDKACRYYAEWLVKFQF